MDRLTFTSLYKGQRRQFEISPVSGTGGMYHLYIDKLYFGIFQIRNDAWVFMPQKEGDFTPEQCKILVDRLTEYDPPFG